MINKAPNAGLGPQNEQWRQWVEGGVKGLDRRLEDKYGNDIANSLSAIQSSMRLLSDQIDRLNTQQVGRGTNLSWLPGGTNNSNPAGERTLFTLSFTKPPWASRFSANLVSGLRVQQSSGNYEPTVLSLRNLWTDNSGTTSFPSELPDTQFPPDVIGAQPSSPGTPVWVGTLLPITIVNSTSGMITLSGDTVSFSLVLDKSSVTANMNWTASFTVNVIWYT